MSSTSYFVRCLSAVAGVLFAVSANANLIVNGGFGDNNVAAGRWAYFSSANVNGWDGSNIEIWDTFNGVVAPEGTQHAELNAHPATGGVFSIYQNFVTVIGQTYDVSFSTVHASIQTSNSLSVLALWRLCSMTMLLAAGSNTPIALWPTVH